MRKRYVGLKLITGKSKTCYCSCFSLSEHLTEDVCRPNLNYRKITDMALLMFLVFQKLDLTTIFRFIAWRVWHQATDVVTLRFVGTLRRGERASSAFQTKSGVCRRASLVSFNTRLLCVKLVEHAMSGRARPTVLYNLFHSRWKIHSLNFASHFSLYHSSIKTKRSLTALWFSCKHYKATVLIPSLQLEKHIISILLFF